MNIEQRVFAWSKLGKVLRNELPLTVKNGIEKSTQTNVWFTSENIQTAIHKIAENLTEEQILHWLSYYKDKLISTRMPKNVGVVMAGNIPLVGFHDFLCVLTAGHNIQAKLSYDDSFLLPAIADILCEIEPDFKNKIQFNTGKLQNFDAVIATGSNNTARYFEYYFGKYPNLIRKNRNSIAILTGNETKDDLNALADDIFMYFGLGCRSISKIFVPKEYAFDKLNTAFSRYNQLLNHPKYGTCYSYYKSIYSMGQEQWIDIGNILLLNSQQISAPVSVLNFGYYSNTNEMNSFIDFNKDNLQCIVSSNKQIKYSIPFGTAQSPKLNDYADGIDTMNFLINL